MKLLIFTQKVDKNDSTLGFFHSWLIGFANRCESVKVICLYKGEYDLPTNVEVYSLGKEEGEGKIAQLIGVYRLLFKLNGTYDKVFVHMNPIYLVLCGLYFKIKKIPIYMWYVHREVDLKLKTAVMFSDKIFSSTKESFGIKTKKVIFLGHGIDVSKLPYSSHDYSGGVLQITHIGRITPIKNIEILIFALSRLKGEGLDVKLKLFGDCVNQQDEDYKKYLEKIIEEKGLKNEVFFEGGFLYKDLAIKLKDSHITVNMTPPGGMDKVVLESLVLGIPTFASNIAFIDLFGEYKDLFMFKFKDSDDLAEKISKFIKIDNKEIIIKLSNKVRDNFSLDYLLDKIVSIMK